MKKREFDKKVEEIFQSIITKNTNQDISTELDTFASNNKEIFDSLIKYIEDDDNLSSDDFFTENKNLLEQMNIFSNYREHLDEIAKIITILKNKEKEHLKKSEIERYDKLFSENENCLLFKNYKKLKEYIRKNDKDLLIDFKKIKDQYDDCGYFRNDKFYYKTLINGDVFDKILENDEFNIDEYNFFIKLNGNFYQSKKENNILQEEAINPGNPKWMENFFINRNGHESFCYNLSREDLDDKNKESKICKTFDYNRGIRRIEGYAKRENDGRLSMMIEELCEEKGILIGRCFHFDSMSKNGTNFLEVELNHLDFAMNIYFEKEERINKHLDKNEKVKADKRTHYFRIEKFPLKHIIFLLNILCVSEYLKKEVIESIFEKVRKK